MFGFRFSIFDFGFSVLDSPLSIIGWLGYDLIINFVGSLIIFEVEFEFFEI